MKDHATCFQTHIQELKTLLQKKGFEIWGEHSQGDGENGEAWDGWVNIYCRKCDLTHETNLNPKP